MPKVSSTGGVTSFVHVGLVVEDLAETARFLALLGLDCDEPAAYSGEWIDRIIGLDNVTVEVVMDRVPDGSDVFEVLCYVRGPEGLIVELAQRRSGASLAH